MVEVVDPPAAETQDRNRQRGGGPRSESGQARAGEEAPGEPLFAEGGCSRQMALSILERNTLLGNQFCPKSPYETMLVADLALAKTKLDRVATLQIKNCEHSGDHIALFWDQEQHSRALKLFARLPKSPSRMAHELSWFKQGAELVIRQWEGLAAVAAAGVDWDEAQRRLAMDLLGVSLVLRRRGSAPLLPTGDTAGLAALAGREIARLQHRVITHLETKDVYQLSKALEELAPELDPTSKRLDRYEAIYKRDYNKAETELARVQKEGDVRLGGIVPRARAWDVDPLIRRIQRMVEPPVASNSDAVDADAPAGTGARANGPVVEEPQPQRIQPAPEPATIEPVAETTCAVPAATPASPADTPVARAARPEPVAPESIVEPTRTETLAPRSRRARKELQRRLKRAESQAAGKGQ